MKIVIASWFYEGQPGYLDFKYRIEALAERYEVTLLLRNACFEQEFAGLPLRTRVFSTAGTGVLAQLWFMRRCAEYCRRERPGLLVLLGSQLAITSYLLRGVPTLLYWNEHPTHFFYPDFRNPLKRLVYRGLLRLNYGAAKRVDKVMPIGEAHLERLLRHGVDPARAELIYMGVQDRFGLLARAEQGGELRLVYTGTVMRERGRDVMLEGLALARQRGCCASLTIVGADAEQLAYCRQRAAELGLDGAVSVVGRVPGSAIPAYLAAADVGICIWEDRVWWRFNPPTKLFEYLVAGLPVLGSRIRTHSDYIADGENGWIFDYDAAAFAAALERVARQRERLPAVSRAAHESGKKYLWSAIEPQFLRLVQRTMGPPS
ncbi:glycosyltransferase [Rugamonas sp. DEMB1]|uniref:glycosyltransferase n=1 Tax=Rugamonas sp. DEMB1 TaxID=3039386 RepID=UPI002448CBF2|nr:glycosyltransferase [Rugamonas sp. DEMB1]WGG49133.1 glycosyltransferase [Rugamonas sp. DEMB1]